MAKIAFVGGGVMAEALMEGVLRAGLGDASNIRVGEPLVGRRNHLGEKLGVETTEHNLEAVSGAELVFLAVKPQSVTAVFAELEGKLDTGCCLVSIIAGCRITTLTAGLAHDTVVRVMPNTPAQIGAGMSVWTCSPDVPQETRDSIGEVLRTLGDEIQVPDESLVEMATALSASGPAYVFSFLEALTDAGVYLGMTRDMASRLSVQTVLGSAKLVQQTGKHPAELANLVTSPGGTTAEALLSLEESGFRAAVMRAVVAAYEKALALGADR